MTGAQLPGRQQLPGPNLCCRRRGRVEHQPETVDAIEQSGRLRTVVDDMDEMADGDAEMHPGTVHVEGAILGLADIALDRLVEARPTRAALELGLRGEHRQV